ncbi:hypothetical protein KI387_000036, partial [Taxus chinensis]
SGSGSTSSLSTKSPVMGALTPPRPPPPPPSISELFDGWTSKSNGGPFGFGTESSRAGFTQQRSGVMGRESIQSEGIATQRGPGEGNYGGSSALNVNGGNSQRGQRNPNLSDAFLGSSLYYGGRDQYSDPSTARTEGYHGSKKDSMDDDTNSSKASRGNWWQ